MSIHLITGYAGTEHITAANDGLKNAFMFGGENFIFDYGEKLAAEIVNNNTVRIKDGAGMMNGRFFEMPSGTYEDVDITNGAQNVYRNDLICIRYEKNTDTGIESTRLVVIKGDSSTSEAGVDPAYNSGSILDGNSIVDFPIYRVKLNGLVIEQTDKLASEKNNIDYEIFSIKKSITTLGVNLSTINGKVTKATTDITTLKTRIAALEELVNKCEKRTLLWTNPSPTAAFAHPQITVASGYTTVEIETNNGYFYKISDKTSHMYEHEYSKGTLYRRDVGARNGIVIFDDARQVGNVSVTDNTMLVPYKIYGIS